MYASDARIFIRTAARDATDNSAWADGDIDRALYFVVADFLRNTRASRRIDTLALSSGSNALPALPSGFRPELAMAAWLDAQKKGDVDLVDYSKIREWQGEDDSSGKPTAAAFDSTTTGVVYPTPDAAYNLKLEWKKMQAAWQFGAVLAPVAVATVAGGAVTAITLTSGGGRYGSAPTVGFTGGGGAAAAATATIETTYGQVTGFTITNGGGGYTSAPTVTFDTGSADQLLLIPDDLLPPILMDGAAGHLQAASKADRDVAAAKWQRYLEYRARLADAGHYGAHAVHRDTAWK
jgi:hypothetical protein